MGSPAARAPRPDHDGGFAGSGAEIGGGGERAELATVRVAPHDGVKRAEVDVVIVIELAGQQDHASAGAEHRLAGGDMLCDRLEQAGGAQQLALRGALAAGQDHPVDSIVEILGRAQQLPRRAETIQHGGVLGERALHGEDAGHAMLRGFDAGRCFLRNVFNCYNHYRSCAFGYAGPAARSRCHACAVRGVTRHAPP